jgi:hypothetical protein
MVRTTKSALAEEVVEVVVVKARPMNDLGNLKGVGGARRNPRKRYGFVRK